MEKLAAPECRTQTCFRNSLGGVILGKRVIITLKDFAKPFVGLLHFEEIKDPHGKPEPVFRIGNVTFTADEIISIVKE